MAQIRRAPAGVRMAAEPFALGQWKKIVMSRPSAHQSEGQEFGRRFGHFSNETCATCLKTDFPGLAHIQNIRAVNPIFLH
jgi:hypothetical protein